METVRNQVSERAASLWLEPDDLTKQINIAHVEICKRTEALKGYESIAANGTAGHNLPDDWLKTVSLNYIDGGDNPALDYIEYETYLVWSASGGTGTPSHYTIGPDEKLYLYLTPTSITDTYMHVYVKLGQELVSGTDVPYNDIKRLYAYHQEIADLATDMVIAKSGKLPTSAVLKAFQPRINDMRKLLNHSTKRGIVKMKRKHPKISTSTRRVSFPSNYP
jgi:hypothetical protein